MVYGRVHPRYRCDGRFFGRRVNREHVPFLPAWAVGRVLNDRRGFRTCWYGEAATMGRFRKRCASHHTAKRRTHSRLIGRDGSRLNAVTEPADSFATPSGAD